MVKKLTGIISKIIDLTEDVKHFEINLPENLEFKGGQFVNLSFKIDEELYRRPLSIANGTKIQDKLELCVKLVKEGHMTPKLWQKKEGDEVEIMGPLGLFTLEKTEKEKLVFIGTGTGIAPLRSMIYELLEKNSEEIDQKEITLIFGVRENGKHLYDKEFKFIEEKFANFKYVPVLSRPNDTWEGRSGYVQDNLDIIDPINSQFFICGLPPMVNAVENKLMDKGIPKELIHCEKY